MASSRLSALRHPAFWGCLALLVANDHLLKGAGLLPSVVTGKLSDFAGLVVAPVLAAALLGARGRFSRWLAFAVPVVPFVAIKVSPAAAHGLEAAMAAVGVPWRIWTDPTDLVALAVLPLSFRLSAWAPRSRVCHRGLLERVGAVAGAIACVATSPPPATGGTWLTDAYVANESGAIDLRVRWVSGAIDCDLAETRVAEVFGRDAFDEGVTFHLEMGDTIPLDRNAAGAAAGFDASISPSAAACDAVLLQAEGMANTVIFWRRGELQDIDPNLGTRSPGAGSIALLRVANEDGMPISAAASEGIVATPLVEQLEPEQCLGAGDDTTFSWSENAQGNGTVTIASLDRSPDGCFALTLSNAGDLPSFFFVCVPAAAFPFEAGDTVSIAHLVTPSGERSLRLERAASGGRPGLELVVFSGVVGVDTGSVTGQMVDTDCVGDRLDCGGFAIPGALHVTTDAGDDQTIVAGGQMSVDVVSGTATVMVGRVEKIVLALPECQVGRNTLGIWGDVLVLTEED